MKPITFTDDAIVGILNTVKEQLKKTQLFSNTNKVTVAIPEVTPESPIIINYTGLAWAKMRELVRTCSKEIAWQGVVHANQEHTVFDVVDILVYPQTIASATVDMDDDAYEPWHQSLSDEQYNNLRLQGHSHVNMATNPSGVDTDTYMKLLEVIRPTSYYIFVITNKSGSAWYRIFDKANNKVYNDKDIQILVDGVDMHNWYVDNYNQFIKTTRYNRSTAPTTSGLGYNNMPSGLGYPHNSIWDLPEDSCPIGFNDTPSDSSIAKEILSDPLFACDSMQAFEEEKNKRKTERKKKTAKKGGTTRGPR